MRNRTGKHSVRSLAGIGVLLYYLIFMSWLWVSRESDLAHWISLVIIPLVLIIAGTGVLRTDISLKSALRSVGLRRGNLRTGLLLGALSGLGLGVFELLFSNVRDQVWHIVTSGAVISLPLAFMAVFLT